MSDIVERLRRRNRSDGREVAQPDTLADEAATEIERLRAALMDLADTVANMKNPRTAADVALLLMVTLGPALERARAALSPLPAPTILTPFVARMGCPVCGIGSDGKPYAYACTRNDCPTRVT